MTINTIVVALSLEADSKMVADRAIQLAGEHGAQLVGVHVIQGLNLFEQSLPTSLDEAALERIIRDESASKLRSLLTGSERPAIISVEAGSPHIAIEALAASHEADLVITGSGVPRGVREIVFGSTADRIVRSASRPVLVVRNPAGSPYKHIAIGVDFSEHSEAAAMFSARLAPSASRELVHAVAVPLAFKQAMLAAGTPQNEIDQYRRAVARKAKQKILESFEENGRFSKSPDITVVEGSPAKVLLEASQRCTTDLLVLGTQGENAVAEHLLGSVTRRVLAESVCDVLVGQPTM